MSVYMRVHDGDDYDNDDDERDGDSTIDSYCCCYI